jgi:hypothetical protein
MYSSSCLGISGGFFSKSFNAFAIFLLQSFSQLLQTDVQCGVPVRDLKWWLFFLSIATWLLPCSSQEGHLRKKGISEKPDIHDHDQDVPSTYRRQLSNERQHPNTTHHLLFNFVQV